MIFDDVMKALDSLSSAELRQLKKQIENREQILKLQSGTVDMDSLLTALENIRAGLSDEEYSVIEKAMNEEYIESLDSDV